MGWLWTTNRQRINKLRHDLQEACVVAKHRFDRLEDLIMSSHSKMKGAIMATQAELTQQLNDLSTQLGKVFAEVTGKIADLETAINNQSNVTPELQSAFDALKAKVQNLDDLVPDQAT